MGLSSPYEECIKYSSLYLFIVSHMRSRSSLLAHILGSHPDIIGYSELHRSYSTSRDLARLQTDIYLHTQQDPNNKYILDKILHNSHKISLSIFQNSNIRFIFLLREPESTIKSLIHMSCKTGIEYYTVPDNALDYYCSRVYQMERYALLSANNGFFIESDALIDNTDAVLCDLAAWLGLKTSLSAEYSVFEHTGQFGYGDPLNIIRSGTVLKTNDHNEIRLPRNFLENGKKMYDSCKKTLTELFGA